MDANPDLPAVDRDGFDSTSEDELADRSVPDHVLGSFVGPLRVESGLSATAELPLGEPPAVDGDVLAAEVLRGLRTEEQQRGGHIVERRRPPPRVR